MESFLASCIPNLKFYFFSLQFYGFNFEVNTDGGDERSGERVVRESEQDARLAHARVADQQQFEQQIVRLLGHGGSARAWNAVYRRRGTRGGTRPARIG